MKNFTRITTDPDESKQWCVMKQTGVEPPEPAFLREIRGSEACALGLPGNKNEISLLNVFGARTRAFQRKKQRSDHKFLLVWIILKSKMVFRGIVYYFSVFFFRGGGVLSSTPMRHSTERDRFCPCLPRVLMALERPAWRQWEALGRK